MRSYEIGRSNRLTRICITKRKEVIIKVKTVIRENCFETNSSSEHVIAITKNDSHITPEELTTSEINGEYNCNYVYLGKGKLWLYDIEYGYGRAFDILTTFVDKLQYAMCEYLGDLYGDEQKFADMMDVFNAIAKDVIPGFKEFDIRKIEKDIYLDTNGNEIQHNRLKYQFGEYDSNHNWVDHYTYVDTDGNEKEAILDENSVLEVEDIGLIDHQSVGMLTNFIKNKGITLKEFLTNKKYVIITDSDETCNWPKLKQSGMFDLNTIVEEYSKSYEDIEFEQWKKEQEEMENKDEESTTK